MDKSNFLYFIARWRSRFRCFTGKKWPWRGLAMGAYRILPDDLSDLDIDRIFRTTAISFSCHAVGDHVRSLGSSHIMEEGS
jgi:hypothetical protein